VIKTASILPHILKSSSNFRTCQETVGIRRYSGTVEAMRVSKALVVAFAAHSFAATPSFKAANATAANANATSIVPGAYIAQFNPGHVSVP